MSLHQKEYVAQSLENQGKLSAQRALADPIDLSWVDTEPYLSRIWFQSFCDLLSYEKKEHWVGGFLERHSWNSESKVSFTFLCLLIQRTYATATLLKDVATCSHLHLDSPSIQVAQSHNKANEDAASKLKLLPPPRVFGDSTSDQLSILNHLIPNQNDPQSQKESNDLMEWAVKWTKDLLAGVISLNQEEKDIIGNQELFGGLKSEQGRRQLVVDVVVSQKIIRRNRKLEKIERLSGDRERENRRLIQMLCFSFSLESWRPSVLEVWFFLIFARLATFIAQLLCLWRDRQVDW